MTVCVCVSVRGVGRLVPGFGDTALCYAEYLARRPSTGPFPEKSRAITRSFLRRVTAGEIGTFLAQD